MLLVFDVTHRSGAEQFSLREQRLREGTMQRPISQVLSPGKLVISFLDSSSQIRSWEVVDDPLATEYEYPAGENAGFGHTIVRKDSSSLAVIVPFDPFAKSVRFESIDTNLARTELRTLTLTTP